MLRFGFVHCLTKPLFFRAFQGLSAAIYKSQYYWREVVFIFSITLKVNGFVWLSVDGYTEGVERCRRINTCAKRTPIDRSGVLDC